MAARTAAACVVLMLSVATVAQAQALRLHRPHQRSVSLLYVLTAGGGTLVPEPGHAGQLTLTLDHVDRSAVWFSDRPVRASGSFPSATMARDWRGFGFASQPPNAALDYTDAASGATRTVILELSRPRYDKRHHALSFQVRVIDPRTVTAGNLAQHARRADRAPATRFMAGALFIDDTVAPWVDGCIIQPDTSCLGSNMFDANLSGLDLAGVNLAASTLFDDNFNSAEMIGANLTNVTVGTNTTFAGTDLASANLYRDDFYHLNMAGADLSNATMTYDNLTGSDLAGAQLVGVSYLFGSADEANLTGADLSGANLSWTWLINANLTNANLSHANLYYARLNGARLCNTTMPNGTVDNSGC